MSFHLIFFIFFFRVIIPCARRCSNVMFLQKKSHFIKFSSHIGAFWMEAPSTVRAEVLAFAILLASLRTWSYFDCSFFTGDSYLCFPLSFATLSPLTTRARSLGDWMIPIWINLSFLEIRDWMKALRVGIFQFGRWIQRLSSLHWALWEWKGWVDLHPSPLFIASTDISGSWTFWRIHSVIWSWMD